MPFSNLEAARMRPPIFILPAGDLGETGVLIGPEEGHLTANVALTKSPLIGDPVHDFFD